MANQPSLALPAASVAAIVPALLAHTCRLAKRLTLTGIVAGRGSGAQATISSTTVRSTLFAVASRSTCHVHAKSSLTAFVLAAHPAAFPASIVAAFLAHAIRHASPLDALTDITALESGRAHTACPPTAIRAALFPDATGNAGRQALSPLAGFGSLASAAGAPAAVRPALLS